VQYSNTLHKATLFKASALPSQHPHEELAARYSQQYSTTLVEYYDIVVSSECQVLTRTTKASATESEAQAHAMHESLPRGIRPFVAPVIGALPSLTACVRCHDHGASAALMAWLARAGAPLPRLQQHLPRIAAVQHDPAGGPAVLPRTPAVQDRVICAEIIAV
jgi:hypothetical protein